jgi:hypothetical protein
MYSTPDLDLAAALALGLTLPDACERAEDHLADGVVGVIQATVGAITPKLSSRVSETRFVLYGVVYEVRVREVASDANILSVVVGETGACWQLDTFSHTDAKVDGPGSRYTTISLDFDVRLARIADDLTDALVLYFQDGYRRLEAHVVRELLDIEYKVANHLYAELRSVLDKSVASRVGLYALLDDERSVYMLDPLAILAVLDYSAHARPSASSSPLKLTALLVRGWVKPDETVAKQALKVDELIPMRLADMSYTTAPDLEVAEERWYGSTALVQPLVRHGHIRLVAAYPLAFRERAEPKLDGIADQLAAILAEHSRSTKKLVHKDRGGSGRGWDAGSVADVAGQFVGGFTKSHIQP